MSGCSTRQRNTLWIQPYIAKPAIATRKQSLIQAFSGEYGRHGSSKGGKALARNLSSDERHDKARWLREHVGTKMTAEIAILNRTAIALAADSAVTIGRGEGAKTYLSENKLFEISEKKPIGLMLYNVLDFYGVPWEVLIKDFRQEHGNSACNEVTDWKNIFIKYITDGYCPSEEAQLDQLLFRSRVTLSSLMSEFFDYLRKLPRPSRRRKQKEQFDRAFEDAFAGLIEQKIALARKKRACQEFGDGEFIKEFIQKSKYDLDEMAKTTFPFTLDRNMSSKLAELYFEHWYREVPSDFCTGFVFAGFGDTQKFPALEHYFIRWGYWGQAKILSN